MTNQTLESWIDENKHLPECLRLKADFDAVVSMCFTLYSDSDLPAYVNGATEQDVSFYIQKVFLPFMAIHGYVIKKSRIRLPFHDIMETTTAFISGNTEQCVPETSKKLDEWRKSYAFVNQVIGEFHERKDLFKYIHESWSLSKGIEPTLNTIEGHTYIADAFLWMLARHGLVLGKSYKKLDFKDLKMEVSEFIKERNENSILSI